jgi:hypothetical protein
VTEQELLDKELELNRREHELREMQTRHSSILLDHTSMTQIIPQITRAMLEAPEMHEKIAEKIADKFKLPPVVQPLPHVCPFNAETVTSLQDLGYYFSTAQKAFKGFIFLCIIIGAAAAFILGIKSKIQELWAAIK